jgi:hypothetical protein
MKVTVQSPYTAEVTIAQAEAWLMRNGWTFNAGAWGKAVGRNECWINIPRNESFSDSKRRMSECVMDIAEYLERPPADILREMSEVV